MLVPKTHKPKFLVLKSDIKERENDLPHQFFRRKRYRPILEMIFEFLSLIDILPLMKLNKNIASIIKQQKLVENIPLEKENFTKNVKKLLRYYLTDKVYQMNLVFNLDLYKIKLYRILIPVYFYRNFLTSKDCNNVNNAVKNINLGSLGGELLAYAIKSSNDTEIVLKWVKNLDYLVHSYYFPECDQIEEVYISECYFDSHADLKLLFLLKNIDSLTLEKLSYLDQHGITAIYKGIKENNSKIRYINLSHNKLCDHNVKPVVSMIRDCPHIEEIDISDNFINSYGLIEIAEAIDHESSLVRFIAENNKLKDSAGRKFFLALYKSRPRCLKELNLQCNILKRKALKMAGKFISRKDCQLERLNLSLNEFYVEDVLKFLSKIKSTSRLTDIVLYRRDIEKSVILQTVEALNYINEKFNFKIILSIEN